MRSSSALSGLAVLAALAPRASGQLNLLVVGDWGGASTAPYTTAVQLSVAAGMGAVGAANNIKEVFGVGDVSRTAPKPARGRPNFKLPL